MGLKRKNKYVVKARSKEDMPFIIPYISKGDEDNLNNIEKNNQFASPMHGRDNKDEIIIPKNNVSSSDISKWDFLRAEPIKGKEDNYSEFTFVEPRKPRKEEKKENPIEERKEEIAQTPKPQEVRESTIEEKPVYTEQPYRNTEPQVEEKRDEVVNTRNEENNIESFFNQYQDVEPLTDDPHYPSSDDPENTGEMKLQVWAIVIISIGSFLVVLILVLIIHRRCKGKSDAEIEEGTKLISQISADD